jgi:hypothetical protein
MPGNRLPTARQIAFARHYASGLSKTQAYEKAGYMPNGSKKSRQVEAFKLSRRPHVAQAIAKFQQELLPFDIRREQEDAIRNLKALALSPTVDSRTRLAASLAWWKFCEKRQEAETNSSGLGAGKVAR